MIVKKLVSEGEQMMLPLPEAQSTDISSAVF